MPIDRFFHPLCADSETIVLSEEELHHLKVHKIEVGEHVEIINGKGALAQGQLIDKKKGVISVTSCTHTPFYRCKMALVQAILKPAKLDWIIEKGVELGVSEFYFFPAEKSELKQLYPQHIERFERLCIAALKQSGRIFLPSIHLLKHLSIPSGYTPYFGDLRASGAIYPPCFQENVLFINGPEGGFTQKEEEFLRKNAQGVLLSDGILRTETAAIAAAAIMRRTC